MIRAIKATAPMTDETTTVVVLSAKTSMLFVITVTKNSKQPIKANTII